MEFIDKAVNALAEVVLNMLFEIVQDKETDPETRIWAREEIRKFLKVFASPPVILPHYKMTDGSEFREIGEKKKARQG